MAFCSSYSPSLWSQLLIFVAVSKQTCWSWHLLSFWESANISNFTWAIMALMTVNNSSINVYRMYSISVYTAVSAEYLSLSPIYGWDTGGIAVWDWAWWWILAPYFPLHQQIRRETRMKCSIGSLLALPGLMHSSKHEDPGEYETDISCIAMIILIESVIP